MTQPIFLEDINSLLNGGGDVPNLWSIEEKSQLIEMYVHVLKEMKVYLLNHLMNYLKNFYHVLKKI